MLNHQKMHQKMRIRSAELGFPLYRALCVRLLVQGLVDTRSLPDGLFAVLRRTVSARRNTRFRSVPEYNTAGQATLAVRLRRCTLVRREPVRHGKPVNSVKKGN